MTSPYHKAKRGELSPTDLAQIAEQLRAGSVGDDPYSRILALGAGSPEDYRDIVEAFLSASSDPMLARAALKVLCADWGLYREYLSELRQFITGVAWDQDEDVKLQAISLGGEAL